MLDPSDWRAREALIMGRPVWMFSLAACIKEVLGKLQVQIGVIAANFRTLCSEFPRREREKTASLGAKHSAVPIGSSILRLQLKSHMRSLRPCSHKRIAHILKGQNPAQQAFQIVFQSPRRRFVPLSGEKWMSCLLELLLMVDERIDPR